MRFDLSGSNDRELPLILGLMPILPKHAVNVATFEDTTLAPPVGSGPYRVASVDPGRSIRLTRDPNYWGRARPINRGLWNFAELRFDYYRDGNAFFEGFRTGQYDVRTENDPSRWQTGYDFPAVRDGRIVKEGFTTGLPKLSSAFASTRGVPIFADSRVREAISFLFDAEWVNHNFFFDLCRRSASFFDDFGIVRLSAAGRRSRARAARALSPARCVADVLDGTWSPPRPTAPAATATALAAGARAARRRRLRASKARLLRERASGRPLQFEIMVTSRDEERLALALPSNLKRAGIDAQMRLVDAVQYDQRRRRSTST